MEAVTCSSAIGTEADAVPPEREIEICRFTRQFTALKTDYDTFRITLPMGLNPMTFSVFLWNSERAPSVTV
jgi:hypothetical protein